jgi:hypothetical protein
LSSVRRTSLDLSAAVTITLEHACERLIRADGCARLEVHLCTGPGKVKCWEVVAGSEAAIEFKVTDNAWLTRCGGSRC